MSGNAALIGAALASIAAAMIAVRIGWAKRRRTALVGWTVAAAALVLLTLADGAWGLALGVVAGMTAALAIVLYAGWTSPAKPLRPPREPPNLALSGGWRDLGRRLAVFMLAVPVGFAAAQWLAFGAQALLRRAGGAPADTTALMLIAQPIAWSAIMAIQMTRDGPWRMIAAPAAAAGFGTILWSVA